MNIEKSHNKKVFVIGIDGATFDLIKPWIKEGRLPNIANIMRNGVHGLLKSTIHPLTAPAWTSFMTGKNPGKHGVFDFIIKVPGSYNVKLVDSRMRVAESLWNILGAKGKKVGVMNVPLNYPPEKVNGFLISWMDAPGTDCEFTYPAELHNEIKKHIGKYVLTVNFNLGLDDYIKDIFNMIENRAATANYLMKVKEWDFFMVLFSATDYVQHAFWKYMDKNHPGHIPELAKKYGNVIRDVYEKVDEKVGYLINALPKDVNLLIVSDHGAGPLKGVVNLNRWLEQKGLLRFQKDKRPFAIKILKKSFIFLKRRLPVRIKGLLKSMIPEARDMLESKFLSSSIDWEGTKAFAYGAYGNIWINLKGREANGIVEPSELHALEDYICAELLKLTDNKGQQVVEKVYKKEELYRGDFTDRAPDLIVRWVDYAYHSRQRFGEEEKEIFMDAQKMPLTNLEMNGFHKMDGIFIAKGAGIRKGVEITGAEIIDMSPTILYMMGLPIPEDMDGKVLNDIFKSECCEEGKIRTEKTATGAKKNDYEGYSESEAKKVEERLKNLGYI
ncbi:MAG: alkaline phosphatase family protein [Planctomycetota bacterium]